MQKLFISFVSALAFYRNARINLNLDLENSDPTKNTLTLPPCSNQPSAEPCSKKDSILTDSLPYCGDSPLHLLTKNKNYNRHSKEETYHYSKISYPRSSFLKYKENIFISSPTHLFYELANHLPLAQLLQLGLEMCGTYSLSESAVDGFV